MEQQKNFNRTHGSSHDQDDWDEVHKQLLAVQKKSEGGSELGDVSENETNEMSKEIVGSENSQLLQKEKINLKEKTEDPKEREDFPWIGSVTEKTVFYETLSKKSGINVIPGTEVKVISQTIDNSKKKWLEVEFLKDPNKNKKCWVAENFIRYIKKFYEIEATEEAIGKAVIQSLEFAEATKEKNPHRGVWYPYDYNKKVKEYMDENDPDKKNILKPYYDFWKPEYYKQGYANPIFWDQETDIFSWKLKKNASASKAILDWLHGPTIADCHTTLIACQFNAIRLAIGDKKFDELFSNNDTVISPYSLQITFKGIPTALKYGEFMKKTISNEKKDSGAPNNRPVGKPGEWHAFYNHPAFLLKHPAGAFQGENALYMGIENNQQMWGGLGLEKRTEMELMKEMVAVYNEERSNRDYYEIINECVGKRSFDPKIDYKKLLNEYFYDEIYNSGKENCIEYLDDQNKFPKTITVEDIYNSAQIKVKGSIRQGGFVPDVGKKIDIEKIKKLRKN